MRKELVVCSSLLAFVLGMPIVALASVTDLGALASPSVQLNNAPVFAGDTYDYGFCTYWAAMRRAQTGNTIPNSWGNANTWASRASAEGYVVDHVPSAGAVMQTSAGALGHVAYVESTDSSGHWTISEMNYRGWDETDSRVLTPAVASDYNFIH